MIEPDQYPFSKFSKFLYKVTEIDIYDLDSGIYERPKKPLEKPIESNTFLNIFGFIVIWICGIFGILVIFGGFFIPSIILIGIALFLYKLINEADKSKFIIIDENNKLQIKYEKDEAEYQKTINLLNSINSDPEKLREFHKSKKSKIFKNIADPVEVLAKRGYSENFFYKFILKNSELKEKGFLVLQDKGIFPPFWDKKDYPYSCDILIIDPIYKFTLNIEIDEPYSLEGKDPIHFVEKDNENEIYDYSDYWRDNNLSEDFNWPVIRLSEEQIIRWPNICLFIILDFLEIMINKKGFFKLIDIDIPNDFLIRRWTEDEAIHMAENDYRLTYLKKLREK